MPSDESILSVCRVSQSYWTPPHAASAEIISDMRRKLYRVMQTKCCLSVYLSGQFQCAHGKMCIDQKLVCDGTPQCQDRSDEQDCFKATQGCSHLCDNKTRCVPEGFLCDGEQDCLDGTDEANCGELLDLYER